MIILATYMSIKEFDIKDVKFFIVLTSIAFKYALIDKIDLKISVTHLGNGLFTHSIFYATQNNKYKRLCILSS